jgi:hypothetical protein
MTTKAVIYNKETGKHIKEIPVNFWFAFAEEKKADRQFVLSIDNILGEFPLKEGEDITIEIDVEDVFEQLKKAI